MNKQNIVREAAIKQLNKISQNSKQESIVFLIGDPPKDEIDSYRYLHDFNNLTASNYIKSKMSFLKKRNLY